MESVFGWIHASLPQWSVVEPMFAFNYRNVPGTMKEDDDVTILGLNQSTGPSMDEFLGKLIGSYILPRLVPCTVLLFDASVAWGDKGEVCQLIHTQTLSSKQKMIPEACTLATSCMDNTWSFGLIKLFEKQSLIVLCETAHADSN